MLASLALPILDRDGTILYWSARKTALFAVIMAIAAAWDLSRDRLPALGAASIGALGAIVGATAPLQMAGSTLGFWLYLAGLAAFAWQVLERLSALKSPGWVGRLLVPGLFGLLVLFLWQVLVESLQIPRVLLPSPLRVGQALAGNGGLLWQDFRQTFLKSVLAGFTLGSSSGFVVAVLVERSRFLKQGLLPLGSLVSAIPIVGIAPIMVMWFGFDWQSKAAVIVVMTFFPMLVNTLAGLAEAGAIERDLMRSYAAGYRQTLLKLRLPAALPFVFNALKINSTLALIGAIVAEFFGTPVVGMGFRISVEIGRMNLDMVWATIAVAALAGSMFYGALAVVERGLTFWHASYRDGSG
jgi:NitT/TauT family transport system permease protein